MFRANWNLARLEAARAVCQLRAMLVCTLVVSMLVSAAPTHSGHELALLDVHVELIDPELGQLVTLQQDTEFDCSAHPGCHAMAFGTSAKFTDVILSSEVFFVYSKDLPRTLEPPLPQPTNLS